MFSIEIYVEHLKSKIREYFVVLMNSYLENIETSRVIRHKHIKFHKLSAFEHLTICLSIRLNAWFTCDLYSSQKNDSVGPYISQIHLIEKREREKKKVLYKLRKCLNSLRPYCERNSLSRWKSTSLISEVRTLWQKMSGHLTQS